MAIQNMFDDGESKSGAAFVFALSLDAVEALGEAGQMFGRDAGTLVDDGDGVAGALPAMRGQALRLQPDLAAIGTVFQCVVDEILQNLNQLITIAADNGRAAEAFDLDAKLIRFGQRFKRVAR